MAEDSIDEGRLGFAVLGHRAAVEPAFELIVFLSQRGRSNQEIAKSPLNVGGSASLPQDFFEKFSLGELIDELV